MAVSIANSSEVVAIWSQVQTRVIQLAGGDPTLLHPTLSIEHVLQCLDQAQRSQRQSDSKYAVVRSAFNNTCKFIKTVGGLVAKVSSEAFPPSELCYNALIFVIRAWQGYEGVFDSLAGLLGQCVQYLSRMEYYIRGGMDAKLSKVACQHLQLFVEICDRTIKLRNSKRRKLFVFSKIFFLNDNDINDLLAKMKGLVDQEGRLVTAQIFNFTSETLQNSRETLSINRRMSSKMDVLMEDRFDQRKENDLKRRREAILKTLAFDENKVDHDTKEPDPYWQRTYNNYRKWVVPNTGQWIFNVPEYIVWERCQPRSRPILVIEGLEGSGKSYLTTTIIRSLRNRNGPETSGPRTLVGFYFLEGDPKEELKRTANLDVIAKSFVWQFAQADASYLKTVANICDEVKDLDPHEIPRRLLFDNKELENIDATFYVIIDGISDILTEPLIRFLQRVSLQNWRVRVLLTGHPTVFEQLATVKGVSFAKISIGAKNRPDVEMYTERKMDDIVALRDTSRLGVAALRKKIRDTLCEKTGGDYFKINTILKHISTLDYVKDIDHVLADAGKERSQQIVTELEKLNAIRTANEVAEINEIILWITYGREWLKPLLMNSVLYLKTGELSLLPLEEKLQTRYTIFEIDSDGDVDFRSLEFVNQIPERGRALDDSLSPESAKRIKPTEVSMIRHFLHTVCPREIYEKFNFETFFEQKLSRKEVQICKDDKDTAEIKLAFTCLRILTEERDGRRDLLHPYAVRYLLQHLSSVDLAFADREWKSAVGPRLLQLFTDEPSIDSLVWTDVPEKAPTFGWKTRSSWLDGNDGVNEILRWFGDSAVISNITDQACRNWISCLLSSPHPGEVLLKPLARRVAVHWLREPSPMNLARNAFYFVYRFVAKLDHSKGIADYKKKKKLKKPHECPNLETILRIEKYCQEELLKLKTKDALWDVQMAIILEAFSLAGDAENRCRNALRVEPSNWRASYYLARVMASNSEAIKILRSITDLLVSDSKWMQNAANRKLLSEIFFELGQKHWAAQQPTFAAQAHIKSFETNFAGYDRILTIFEQYREKERFDDIVAVLDMIEKSPQADLFEMLVHLATREPIHDIILQTALETARMDLLVNIYDGAVQLATNQQAYVSLYYIRFHYGNALYQRIESEERAIPIWETALKEDLPRSYLNVEATLPTIILKLAPVYLRKARAAGHDSQTAGKYLEQISNILPDETTEHNMVFHAKLYLARYYYVQGDVIRAKQVTRSAVKMALEILSDNDEDNDYLAYWRLLLVFLPLDDDKNAFAAVAMAALANETPFARNPVSDDEPETDDDDDIETFLPKPKRILTPEKINLDDYYSDDSGGDSDFESDAASGSNSETPGPNSGKKQDSDNPQQLSTFAICNGQCGHCWDLASEMFWCKDCINITFDGTCFQKLRHGWLPLNVCDKDHEFMFIPKWDEAKMGQIPKGYVPYGDKGISLEEWKREIKRDYVDFDA